MQGKGIGFGAEGDYKTSALNAVYSGRWPKDGKARPDSWRITPTTWPTAMCWARICWRFRQRSRQPGPPIEVHPLGIGGKADPGPSDLRRRHRASGVAVCMIGPGERTSASICANIELIAQPKPMPKLPVAQIMWTLKAELRGQGAKAWIEAGGGPPYRGFHRPDGEGYRAVCQVYGIRSS